MRFAARMRITPLAALAGSPLTLGADKSLPTRLLVVPWGTSQTRLGPVTVNATTLAQFAANQAAAKFDRVAFDFQHATVKAKPGDEPIRVAGYGTPEIVEGEGIYLSAITYTDEGHAVLPQGHYPDISPTVLRNEAGEVMFLHSVGAVRQGEIDGLTLFGAPAPAVLTALSAEMAGEGSETADWRAIVVGLLNALGTEPALEADAVTDDALAAAADTLATRLQAKPGAAKRSPQKPATDTPDHTPDAMSAETIAALTERLTALEANQIDTRRDQLVAQATRDGKVIPLSAEDIAKCDLTILEAMIGKLPVTVPLESRTGAALDNFAADPGASATAEEKHVASILGLKAEELAPHRRA